MFIITIELFYYLNKPPASVPSSPMYEILKVLFNSIIERFIIESNASFNKLFLDIEILLFVIVRFMSFKFLNFLTFLSKIVLYSGVI